MVLLADTTVLVLNEPVSMGAVGYKVGVLLVPFPYGAPLALVLEGNPLEASDEVVFAVIDGVAMVLLVPMVVEGKTPVEKGAVGPREIVLLVPLPYGAPLEETLDEKPFEAVLEVELKTFVGALLVVLTAMGLAVVTGAVGPTMEALLVPFPYGAPLVAALENEVPLDEALMMSVGTPMITDTLLMLLADEGFPVEIGAVGPTVGVPLVPLPYGAPLTETLEEKPLEAALEVLTISVGTPMTTGTLIVLLIEVAFAVETGIVGPTTGVLFVSLP